MTIIPYTRFFPVGLTIGVAPCGTCYSAELHVWRFVLIAGWRGDHRA